MQSPVPVPVVEPCGPNVFVVRDDLLPGGTKSVLVDALMGGREDDGVEEYVYASPCEGGFQVALAHGAVRHGKRATIVCARRQERHPNTQAVASLGAGLVEVFPGYLSTVQARAREYVAGLPRARLLTFGGHEDGAVETIAARMRAVLSLLPRPPSVVWCAVGSGSLLEGIVAGTDARTRVVGVQVGKPYPRADTLPGRVQLRTYPAKFPARSRCAAPFPCMAHYDRKAYECMVREESTASEPLVLFWNVMGDV